MVTKPDTLIVPLINEAFGEDFTDRAEVILRHNKNVMSRTDGAPAGRESDAGIELSEVHDKEIHRIYLIECEAWFDRSILLRIAEADSSVTVETARITDEGVVLTHPGSAVIFLHPNRRIPGKMKITHCAPNGDKMSVDVPALQIKDYSVEEIFRKRLIILLPFCLFRFANDFHQMEENEMRRKELGNVLTDINQRLEVLRKQGAITEYQKRTTQELLLRVSERLAAGFRNIKKEVDEIMTGALLRTTADEILEQGREEGREEGRKLGENAVRSLFDFLVRHGRSEDVAKAASDQEYFSELMLRYRNGELGVG